MRIVGPHRPAARQPVHDRQQGAGEHPLSRLDQRLGRIAMAIHQGGRAGLAQIDQGDHRWVFRRFHGPNVGCRASECNIAGGQGSACGMRGLALGSGAFGVGLAGNARGEVPEWSNGAVSKTVVRASVPRVRIPVSPPFINILILMN